MNIKKIAEKGIKDAKDWIEVYKNNDEQKAFHEGMLQAYKNILREIK